MQNAVKVHITASILRNHKKSGDEIYDIFMVDQWGRTRAF